MKRYMLLTLICMSVALTLLAPRVGQAKRIIKTRSRFAPVHIYLDSGSHSLAAYQFELKAIRGTVKIVGVEGGAHPAFREAPYYDPAALAQDRIIIAAFNTGDDLPTGRTRIATLHLQVTGDAEPQYQLELTVATDTEGQELPAGLTLKTGEDR